jgi:ribosomal protein S12
MCPKLKIYNWAVILDSYGYTPIAYVCNSALRGFTLVKLIVGRVVVAEVS